MSLIYNRYGQGLEVAVLDAYEFKSEVGMAGSDSNTFSLTVPNRLYRDLEGVYIRCPEHPEHGGRITSVHTDGSKGTVTFYGRTWLGLLDDYLDFAQHRGSTTANNTVYTRMPYIIRRGFGCCEDDRPSTNTFTGRGKLSEVIQKNMFTGLIGFRDKSDYETGYNYSAAYVYIYDRQPQIHYIEAGPHAEAQSVVTRGLREYNHIFMTAMWTTSYYSLYKHADGTYHEDVFDGGEGPDPLYTGDNMRTYFYYYTDDTKLIYREQRDKAHEDAVRMFEEFHAAVNTADLKITHGEEMFVGDIVITREQAAGYRVRSQIVKKTYTESQTESNFSYEMGRLGIEEVDG